MNNEWQPMESAPKDGTRIRAEIPGHGDHYIISWDWGYVDSNEYDCGAWAVAEDQEPPVCWTDGVCWEVNEDGVKSVKPIRWMPLPPKQNIDNEQQRGKWISTAYTRKISDE